MAKQVLTNVALWFGQYNIQSQSNAASVELSADEVDVTSYADDTHVNQGGLKTAVMSVSGFWDAATVTGAPDSKQFSDIGSAVPMTIAMAPTAGEVSYFLNALHAQYNSSARIGEALGFQARAGARDKLIRGTLMESRVVTASGSGAARQLGQVTAAQRVYAILHVTSASGTTPSFTARLESDNGSGFPSATTRITFTAATAITSEFLSATGAITDDWWRIAWTVSGGSPSFTWAAAVGVL